MGEKSRRAAHRRAIGALIAAIAVVAGALAAPLPAQAAAAVSAQTVVAQVLSDTNALRAAGGLPPLIHNPAMDSVAATWTAHMAATGDFAHNPNYSTQIPSGWTGAAENIAAGYSYLQVVQAWHNSPGHYANIMGSSTDIGIGYAVASNGQTYFTEDFGTYKGHSATAILSSPAPTPMVSGNQILDTRTGKAWVPHAINWPSFEYACQQGWGESADGATAGAASAMASWGITAVRIPLNQDCWLGVDGSPATGTTASYKQALSAWVSILNSTGLVVILDLHWTAPAGFAADGQRAMPDAQSVTFWQQVAAAYKTSPSVLFETFNEPYSRGSYQLTWGCWKNGGCQVPSSNDADPIGAAAYTAHGQAEIVGGIRAAGAMQPILLDGLNYANDLTGWLANRPNDSQLIASWHNYPGQGCSDVTCWNAQISPVAATVPVIATEFGMVNTDPSYFNGFMTWADAHGIGYAPWAWWVTTSSDGDAANLYALISSLSTFAPRAPEGTAYRDHLLSLGPVVDRVWGADRYSGAITVAKAAYPTTAPVVYVATGTNYPDALSASAAAAHEGGPLLLTAPTSLRPDIAAEISQLHPARIVIVGGTASVSAEVESQLVALQPNTVRISGADRYATSRALVAAAFLAGVSQVYVATGQSFPDALSAAAGGKAGAPVLLVPGTSSTLDSQTIRALTKLDPQQIRIVGGDSAMNSHLDQQFQAIAPTDRVAGSDRYATSVALNAAAYSSADRVFLATGANFPDALGGSAWAASVLAPLFVVPTTCVPQSTLDEIGALGASYVTLLGGTSTLTAGVSSLIPC